MADVKDFYAAQVVPDLVEDAVLAETGFPRPPGAISLVDRS
jgi:hypothetical protein